MEKKQNWDLAMLPEVGKKLVDVERIWWNDWQTLWWWIPNNQTLLVSNSDLLIGLIRFSLVLQEKNSCFQ